MGHDPVEPANLGREAGVAERVLRWIQQRQVGAELGQLIQFVHLEPSA